MKNFCYGILTATAFYVVLHSYISQMEKDKNSYTVEKPEILEIPVLEEIPNEEIKLPETPFLGYPIPVGIEEVEGVHTK